MAMAHSVGKPFHLISDTEAGEACARPSDKVGGALHTAAFADQRRVDAAGGSARKPWHWAYTRKFKKSNNKIWIKWFFSFRIPSCSVAHKGSRPCCRLPRQLWNGYEQFYTGFLSGNSSSIISELGLQFSQRILLADFVKSPTCQYWFFGYSEVPKQKNSLSFSIKSPKLDCRQVGQPCWAEYLPCRDVPFMIIACE